jgi:hypothetical protein
MSSRSEGADAFRRLLQETHRQRPTALIGASSLRAALGLPDEAMALLLAEAVNAGELVPEDVIRCANCRREAEPGVTLEHFVCHECEREKAVEYRVYAITDKVFSSRNARHQKKTRKTRSSRWNPFAKVPFLRRFSQTRRMMMTI